jgi:adhesin transport system membrane fusion protein
MDKMHFKSLKLCEPRSFIRRVWLISMTILIFFGLTLFLPWEQTVKGKGILTSLHPSERQYTINAPVSGYIEKFIAQEGMSLEEGAPILRMRDLDKAYLKRLENDLNATETEILNTTERQRNLRENIARSREKQKLGLERFGTETRQRRNRVAALELETGTLLQQNETARQNCKRLKVLYHEGLASKRDYELALAACTRAQNDLDKNRLAVKTEKEALTLLQIDTKQFMRTTQSQIANLESALLALKNRQLGLVQKRNGIQTQIRRYQNAYIVARKEGYVVRILQNDADRFIKQGEPLLLFAPRVSDEALRIEVSDFNMPLIHTGLKVRIMFYGWPAFQISGWPKITYGSYGGIITRVEHTSHREGFYYAYVTPDPEDEPWPGEEMLRIGTQATVWVRLDTVPLWYQIWRLMQAAPPKMIIPDREKY